MLDRSQITSQDYFVGPQDLRHLCSTSVRQFVERSSDKTERLRKALGLPLPAPNRVALGYKQIAWAETGDRNGFYVWQSDHRRTLNPNLNYGAGMFVIGFHEKSFDHDTKRWVPTGPVQVAARRCYNTETAHEAVERVTNTLPIMDVVLISWPEYRYGQNPPNGFDNAHTVGLKVEFEGENLWVYVGIDVAEALFDVYVDENRRITYDGKSYGEFPRLSSFYFRHYQSDSFDFDMESLTSLSGLHVGEKSFNNLLHSMAMAGSYHSTDAIKKPGLTKLYKDKLKPLAEELFEKREYVAWAALRTLLKSGGRSVRKVKVSVVANHVFAAVTTVEELKDKLKPFTNTGYNSLEKAVESFDYFAEKRKEAVRRDTAKAIRKRVADLDEVDIDTEKYPLTHGALMDGSIPLTCLFPAGETYFLINDNWDLWEEMLSKFPEETKQIAQEAGARRQYERDVMSYFYFVLYALPEYLNKHTSYEWTCSPRLVESQYELEPEAVEEDRGVIKKRSALTPVADNKKHHVVVPYCSMAVHGRMTTYAYAHSYHLLQRGMVFDGNVVTRELEEKLNGKDDYGLMFYTLTGSYTNRGYPTFLIIFERLKKKGKTRVHFHRVHPMRSKDGDRNPVSNWIKVSYNWMIGNVNKDDIAFQQGDLAFVRISEGKSEHIDWSYEQEVTDCDSHCFTMPVPFVKYEGKQKHVLGHVRIDEGGVKLEHPEHDNVAAKRGTFQVRQCRSWEVNPKGIWTLNFD